MSKLVIFGAGDIAELAHYYFQNDSEHEVVAFTVDSQYLTAQEFKGLPLVDFADLESIYPPGEFALFIAVSYARMNQVRASKYLDGKKRGYDLVSYKSTRATIFNNVAIGDNCFILEDNTLQPFVSIGNNVVLWSGNHIGHHSIIEDHCFITSQVVISGGVHVEPYCFIGVNATIRDHITIGEKGLIGAGAVILHSTGKEAVYKSKETELASITSSAIRGM